ncbi:uncharacterized protein Nmag_0258 [Natrialba magadii ATCC 43099]|uniref:Uncharacterized protein n=1 Tax=Natrialba magadii (strain ATCC 43099 / DSM 3394 / CCM 3739 / CIP 104546 / IAM 13178 / JCM 8861 / NBRC 102185 / NCIMB 2190 / MS3) TaxID=547559 RepID=D3SX30_NATMM|nr:hypothetical protein [Natrialba magadii]ADD03850.1 uncharacterized protein Nmag_0258 [Natrialba magadii ATCC 43099]ELY33509.1 hypothetical protein C500_01715 [Natrialba magadii ATCC 43099]
MDESNSGEDEESELEAAIRRNRERCEHMDHSEFGSDYFAGTDTSRTE